MNPSDLLHLRGDEVVEPFRGKEPEIIEAVRAAYVTHEPGDVSIPNCPFLRFPHNQTDRTIPKPASLGGGFQVACLKWVASFPLNPARGLGRASAALIVDSTETGLPRAAMERLVIGDFLPTGWTARHYGSVRPTAPSAPAELDG